MKDILDHQSEEPWRQLANLMATLLGEQIRGQVGYASPDGLTADLDLLSRTLSASGCRLLEEQAIRPVRHKIEMFGFHLATLDVRQNSEFHDQAIAEILSAGRCCRWGKFPELAEEKRLEFLNAELQSSRPFLHDGARIGEYADNVLDTYRVLVRHWNLSGTAGGSARSSSR